jgi:hypothetical protein
MAARALSRDSVVNMKFAGAPRTSAPKQWTPVCAGASAGAKAKPIAPSQIGPIVCTIVPAPIRCVATCLAKAKRQASRF